MKQILITLPDEEYEDIINDEACGLHPLTRAVAGGVVLPEDATNGDMIKVLFPNIPSDKNFDCVKQEYLTSCHKDCPLKSVERLIEKIESLSTQQSVDGQDMYQAYDVLRAIREYCGVSNHD